MLTDLRRLSLSDIAMGYMGAEQFSNLLPTFCSALTELDLSYNRIIADGADALVSYPLRA